MSIGETDFYDVKSEKRGIKTAVGMSLEMTGFILYNYNKNRMKRKKLKIERQVWIK